MKKIFNPNEWLKQPVMQTDKQFTTRVITRSIEVIDPNKNSIESYINTIEQSAIDITGNYATWRDIGFAIANEYGETGRVYFHRISQFHSGYVLKECDEQFDKCLSSKGTGVAIGTFYHHAHNAGVKITKNNEPIEFSECEFTVQPETNPVIQTNTKEEMPTFPDSLFLQLPDFLQKVIEPATSNEERDILLLGSLTVLSACFPMLYGIYDGEKVFSNLFLFVTAPASAGKGRLNQCENLVNPIHKAMREKASLLKQQFEIETAEYNSKKGKDKEKPKEPPESMLFIPANNSATGMFQLLSDNDGKGLIFETEGDTLAQAFKSDYGNYSDGFRKAFHHETIKYYRRTDREYVEIEKPCISTVLSGTPNQVSTLIPNAENGLFSRFMFYYMNIKPVWKNVFAVKTTNGLSDYYNALGEEFLEFYKSLKNNPEIRITLTPLQQEKFNDAFGKIQIKYLNIKSESYIASVRRMGITAFRIAMIFTALRIKEDGDVNQTRVCEDVDFDNVLEMVSVLIKHSSKVFNTLPVETKLSKRSNRKERFLESLPFEFSKQEYLAKADGLNIPHKTAEGYITKFVKSSLLHRESNGKYINPQFNANGGIEGTEGFE
ncbi:MAG: DNA primase, partial [Bacteroidetes bacterium]